MERKKASDFPQELLNLFDGYVHGRIDRRQFLAGAQKFAVGGVTAAALFQMPKPNYAWAVQVPADEPPTQAGAGPAPPPPGPASPCGSGSFCATRPACRGEEGQVAWPQQSSLQAGREWALTASPPWPILLERGTAPAVEGCHVGSGPERGHPVVKRRAGNPHNAFRPGAAPALCTKATHLPDAD